MLESIDSERNHYRVGRVVFDFLAGIRQRIAPGFKIGARSHGVVVVETLTIAMAGFVGITEEMGESVARIAMQG